MLDFDMFENACAKAWIPFELQNSFSKSADDRFKKMKISKININNCLLFSSFSLMPIEWRSTISNNGRNILIPPKLAKIEEGSFSNCQQLRNVKLPENSELKEIDEKMFNSSPNVVIEIPSKLKDSLTINVQNGDMIKFYD